MITRLQGETVMTLLDVYRAARAVADDHHELDRARCPHTAPIRIAVEKVEALR